MSGIGPITIFDKSALQSFNPDEALWFDWFYKTNITPLFYVETLADLNKEMRGGRTPEQAVGSIASKTPVIGSELNVPHQTLCLYDLLGESVRMKRLPVVGRGRSVKTGDRMGIIFEHPPEMEAFHRWQRHEFLDVERLYARAWRQGLAAFDLTAILANLGLPEHARLRLDLSQAKQWAETFVRGERHRFSLLKEAMGILGVPPRYKPEIIRRWKSVGVRLSANSLPTLRISSRSTCSPTSAWQPVIFHPEKTAKSISLLLPAVLHGVRVRRQAP
jgi:hypothetical protein